MAWRTIERVVGIRFEEVGRALLCALSYFLVLCAWFIIRLVREQFGLAGGVENINWLFRATLGETLAATPAYGALVHRLPRSVFIGVVHSIFVGTLLLFGIGFTLADGQLEIWIGRAFYTWASVLNMFLLAVFTALMVDVWSLDGSKRTFGPMAAGGTFGAVGGSVLTSMLAKHLPMSGLLGISSVLFLIGAMLMIVLHHRFARVQEQWRRERRFRMQRRWKDSRSSRSLPIYSVSARSCSA